MADDILARLRMMASYPHKPYPTHYVNPDGPDGAKVIEAQAGRIAALEAALEPFARSTIAVATVAGVHPTVMLMGVTADDLAQAALALNKDTPMPNNNPPVEVIQGEANGYVEALPIDREMAARVYACFRDHDFAGWVRKGENAGGDANFIIQLFARHRLAFQSEARAGEGESVESLWQDLIEKDDRTSPEEYPEHALITFDELADYIARAKPVASHPLPDREAIARTLYEFEPFGDQETDLDGRPTGPGYEIRWDQLPEYAPGIQETFLVRVDSILTLIRSASGDAS